MVEFNVDTGKNKRFLVASYTDRVASELCAVKHVNHEKHEYEDPDKANRYYRAVGRRDLKQIVEPAAFLACCRPRNREVVRTDRTKTAGDHACTQRSKERRQVHDSDQNTV